MGLIPWDRGSSISYTNDRGHACMHATYVERNFIIIGMQIISATKKLKGLMGNSESMQEKSIHDFVVKDTKDKDVSLEIYKGKVLLIVNVASQCGYANSNYTELSELYTQFKDKGFEILAFPCNQFLKQEPGSSQEAEQFACTRFSAEYPIFHKVKVNGANAAPIYKFLKSSKAGKCGSSIKWNFYKFLVDKDGHVIKRYGTSTSPLSIAGHIKKALGEDSVSED